MTNKTAILFTISIELLISACSGINNKSSNIEKLIGTWTLDSISLPSGKYLETEHCVTLTFENNTDYRYDQYCGDANENYSGKYFILENPKRGLKTISLIPDILIDEKDTIRCRYINFDIFSISTDRLQVVDETKYIKRDSLPYIRFNKNYIYKRKK